MTLREYLEWIRNNNCIDDQYVESMFKKILSQYGLDTQEKIKDAYKDAYTMHQGQLRSDGQVYIIHPIRVASMYVLTDIKDERTIIEGIIASLLHDVFEDSSTSIQYIEEKYGSIVSEKIMMLSTKKGNSESKTERMYRKTEKWHRLQNADDDTLTIHACDVCDNAISWRNLTTDYPKLSRWIFQAEEYQLPLLNRRFPILADILKEEIDFEYGRGVIRGSWIGA